MIKRTYIFLFVLSLFFMSSCGNSVSNTVTENSVSESASDEVTNNEENKTETDYHESDECDKRQGTEDSDSMSRKEVIVYFPNWKLNTANGKVSDIPWDQVTMINHAFWKVKPVDSSESSFERREQGLPARVNFTIVSTDPDSDAIIFEEYAKFTEKYPETKIMISIGGWCASGYFSEMAYTEEGRKSFAKACVDLISQHEWIAGIDIDWEYPGGAAWGERGPEGTWNEGCPIFGKQYEDRKNFVEMLKVLRESLDDEFGKGNKLVTACAGAPLTVIKYQNWGAASNYLDFINIMSYDLAGEGSSTTAHASDLSGAQSAVTYLISESVEQSKINIGSPFYGTGFCIEGNVNPEAVVGAKVDKTKAINKEMLTQEYMEAIRNNISTDNEPGWHEGYDDKKGGAYLYNNDRSSDYYGWFISCDNERALNDKIKYINSHNLAGIIVWEITQDTLDHKYTEILAAIND